MERDAGRHARYHAFELGAPVRYQGNVAILKVARVPDEKRGYELMRWWAGEGAAQILASAEDGLLLERATGGQDLAAMARSGRDDEACQILCSVANRLHVSRPHPVPDLHPLDGWFQSLFDAAGSHPALGVSASVARRLLSAPREVLPLHGDLHHGNVLDFGDRGWLAIDPHGLIGERLFDFANIFTNPDLDDPGHPVATLPGRLDARFDIVVRSAQAEPIRMLEWIVAWTGLSASWFMADGDQARAAIDMTINGIARGHLGL